MSPQRWEELEALYLEGSDLPVSEHEAFLCRCEDAELRDRLRAMLAAEPESLTEVVAIAAASMTASQSEPWHGRRIGLWRIVKTLGRGGMGAVYLATRDDGEFQKQAAIKTLKLEVTGPESLQRFRQERQILAALDHPNIARLLDGGATDEGTPYLVMDYVNGVSITEYCDQRRLSVTQRVSLFRQVCDAVQFAHSNLIVHRDLKPANILVTESGVPKLLDFGIAKLLDPAGATSLHTTTGLVPMTPDYASPEQVSGAHVSTATDIYSLGAILYELSTGERPHKLSTYSPAELIEVICKGDVSSPRTRSGNGIDADLDNIVLKAMQKEPARRYASVAQLSEDLGRYLDGLPVLARSDSMAYRMRKYVRRHWVAVSAVAGVVLSMGAGALWALHEARRADARFQQVRRLANTFVNDIGTKLQSVPGATETEAVLVKTALEYLDNLSREAQGDEQMQAELADAYEKVGDIQGFPGEANLGDVTAAEASYVKAAAIRERLWRRNPNQREKASALASTFGALSTLQMHQDRPEPASHYAGRCVEVAQHLFRQDASNESKVLLGRCLNRLGDVEDRSGHLEQALGHFKQAFALREQVLATEPSSRTRVIVAKDAMNVGWVLRRSGQLADAERYYRRAVTELEESRRSGAPTIYLLQSLIVARTEWSSIYTDPRNTDVHGREAALRLTREAEHTAEDFYRRDAKNVDAAEALVCVRIGLATLLQERQPFAARKLLGSAKGLIAERLTSRAAKESFKGRLAQVLMLEAQLEGRRGRVRKAAELMDEALRSVGGQMPGDGTFSPPLPKLYTLYLEQAEWSAKAGNAQTAASALAEAERLMASKEPTGFLEVNAQAGAYASAAQTYRSLARQSRSAAPLYETKAESALQSRAALWQQWSGR